MEKASEWRVWAEWREYQGRIDVSLSYDDQEALINGSIQEYGDESFRVYLGDRPPQISDPLAMRILVAIYQYLGATRDKRDDEVTEAVDLLSWLGDQVGMDNATAVYAALNFKLAEKSPEFLPPSASMEEPSPTWRFAARWLEESGSQWRLARLDLTWHCGQDVGGLAVVVKADGRGVAIVEEVVNDDLLLPMPEMGWLVRQPVEKHWKQMLAYGNVQTEMASFAGWLGLTRGRKGQYVMQMIDKAMRTFGAYRPQP